ncbi:uncharacterized protein LOC128362807 [Scomber japonicus]|uniref:uncharacterized protein LOC128362807 n=1 Tax=Scomber japonicus TaxID=13676 RepID=UPI002306BCE5|nr:uncharacterized protein LOC128362807 [Scomber japonicus]
MIVLWVTLLVLHQAYALIPVITVQLGEPATFTCAFSDDDFSRMNFYWYKQSAGDTLKLIVKLSTNPEYGPGFSPSRLEAHKDKNFINLTILRTVQEDEGMYHCEVMDWIKTKWNGTYLSVKGNSERTSNYTVVQRSTVSDPIHPGDSVTLQCSVLSDSGNKTCSGGHSVYWFRTGSNGSHPDFIYTDGSSPDECRKKSDMNLSPKSCDYHFSKNISSSDAGTYYCAVATCGKILFGNGTKLELVQTTHSLFIGIVILTVCLTVSVVANIVFICNQSLRVREQYKGKESTISEAQHDNLRQPVHEITEADDTMNYAALNFSERKAKRGRKKREFSEDSVYSQVKC